MKATTPGHRYELDSFESPTIKQSLQFIEKQKQGEAFVTINDGTTNEEVLRMLIDRLKTLNAKLPNRQSSIAITKLEEALMWLENRTAERKARGVEGTPKA